jgi:hypothetical protein
MKPVKIFDNYEECEAAIQFVIDGCKEALNNSGALNINIKVEAAIRGSIVPVIIRGREVFEGIYYRRKVDIKDLRTQIKNHNLSQP